MPKLLEEIERIEGLYQKATPAPWSIEPLDSARLGVRVKGLVVSGFAAILNVGWYHQDQCVEQVANAHIIAALHNAWPQIYRALKERADLQAGLDLAPASVGTRTGTEAKAVAWKIAKDRRDRAMMAAAEADEAEYDLQVLKDAGFADHLPTLEEVRAAWRSADAGQDTPSRPEPQPNSPPAVSPPAVGEPK